jgi:uncharacterized protein DUF4340
LKTGRGLILHVALLVVAIVAAVFVWTRDKKAAVSSAEVTIVSGRPADVERVRFQTKGKTVVLESKRDAVGRYFLGTAENQGVPLPDAGPPAPKVVTFVSVGPGDKLAEVLAPFKGVREIGKVDVGRSADFGLKDPEGTLSFTVAGKERTFALGARAGGGDRYVRDEGSSVVYVVKADVSRDLESGEGALVERDLHGFKDPDLESVRILARGKTRTVLRRGPESKRIWADPAEPDKADETVSNWISKVDRLRPSEYLAPEVTPEVVLRLEYTVKGADGVFLELGKLPAGSAPKPEFAVRTERTRRWAKVDATLGEQIEQDLEGGSLLR